MKTIPLERTNDTRLDPATLQKVIALAGEMQSSDRAKLSLAEAEAIAEQVGIEPRYVRAAAQRLVAGSENHPDGNGLTAAELAEDNPACGTSLLSKCALFKMVAFGIVGGMLGAVGAYAFSMPLFGSLLAAGCLVIGACHARTASAVINSAVFTASGLIPALVLDGWASLPRVIAVTLAAGAAGWIGCSLRLAAERKLATRRKALLPSSR